MKSYYEYKKSEWESQYLEYREIDEKKDKANLIDEYTISVENNQTQLIAILENLKAELKNNKIPSLNTADFEVLGLNSHLYNPLLFKDKGQKSLQISPVHLNEAERDFILDLDKYLKDESSQYKDSEIYLLRNQSRTGLGFFAEGNFYPDFIMWLIKDNKQYITFLDPKGIRNCNPEDGPKLNFGIKIKEIEKRLKYSSTILNSFILSNTPLSEINMIQGNDYTYNFFEKKNVLFQAEHNETYISKMFEKIV